MNTFEMLENRTMMSVVPSGTELVVATTLAASNVNIFQKDATTLRIEDNGEVREFVSANFTSIRVTGTAGKDTLKVTKPTGLAMTKKVTFIGLAGDDFLTGGDGNDSIDGGAGNNVMSGGAGNDSLTGGAGNDVIKGDAGNDVLNGGSGNNQMSGGDGNDILKAGTGQDLYDGGAGTDRADYSDRTAGLGIVLDDLANDGQVVPVFVNGVQVSAHFEADNVMQNVENVTTGSGNDSIIAGAALVNNVFNGGAGSDRLRGRNGNDVLSGGDGNDVIVGAAGDDQLNGGNGDDLLDGGAGKDDLRGDAGKDILSGGLGIDNMRGGDGDDFIFAADNAADAVIDGGAGSDFLDRDATDLFSNVEIAD